MRKLQRVWQRLFIKHYLTDQIEGHKSYVYVAPREDWWGINWSLRCIDRYYDLLEKVRLK